MVVFLVSSEAIFTRVSRAHLSVGLSSTKRYRVLLLLQRSEQFPILFSLLHGYSLALTSYVMNSDRIPDWYTRNDVDVVIWLLTEVECITVFCSIRSTAKHVFDSSVS